MSKPKPQCYGEIVVSSLVEELSPHEGSTAINLTLRIFGPCNARVRRVLSKPFSISVSARTEIGVVDKLTKELVGKLYGA